jgi:hypothetical protein
MIVGKRIFYIKIFNLNIGISIRTRVEPFLLVCVDRLMLLLLTIGSPTLRKSLSLVRLQEGNSRFLFNG